MSALSTNLMLCWPYREQTRFVDGRETLACIEEHFRYCLAIRCLVVFSKCKNASHKAAIEVPWPASGFTLAAPLPRPSDGGENVTDMALSKHHVLVCLDADNILTADLRRHRQDGVHVHILLGNRWLRRGVPPFRTACTKPLELPWTIKVTVKLKDEIEFDLCVVHVFALKVLKFKFGQCVLSCASLINTASDSSIIN